MQQHPTENIWPEVAGLVVFAFLCFVAFAVLSSALRVVVEVVKHAVAQ